MYHDVFSLMGEMNRSLLDFDADFNRSMSRLVRVSPVDVPRRPVFMIEETPDGTVLKLEMPGHEKADIKIDIEGSDMLVSAEKDSQVKRESDNSEERFKRIRFASRFHLPDDVDHEKIEATYDQGVLVITLHRNEIGRLPSSVEVK